MNLGLEFKCKFLTTILCYVLCHKIESVRLKFTPDFFINFERKILGSSLTPISEQAERESLNVISAGATQPFIPIDQSFYDK